MSGFSKVEKRQTLKYHILKTNGGTSLKLRGVAVFDQNYSDAKFESRPVIQFRYTKPQSWVFLNFQETGQYFWDRGSIFLKVTLKVGSFGKMPRHADFTPIFSIA